MEKLRVLFVGNSHTFFNDMPTIFQMFCRENGIDAEVVMQAHPGVHLSWHLSQQWELRYGLVQGHFDYMVFQQAAHPCPPMEETLQDGTGCQAHCHHHLVRAPLPGKPAEDV